MSKNELIKSCISQFWTGYYFDEEKAWEDEGIKGHDVFYWAVLRAYPDMAKHTMKIEEEDNIKNVKVEKLKELVAKLLREKLPKLNFNDYDNEHKKISDKIVDEFNKSLDFQEECRFCYGQAQKLLNMTMKYLFMIAIYSDVAEIKVLKDEKNYSKLHVPIDNYILSYFKDKIKEEMKKNKKDSKEDGSKEVLNKSWSKMDYKDYEKVRKIVKDVLKEEIEIIWELQEWPKISREEKIENTKKLREKINI